MRPPLPAATDHFRGDVDAAEMPGGEFSIEKSREDACPASDVQGMPDLDSFREEADESFGDDFLRIGPPLIGPRRLGETIGDALFV